MVALGSATVGGVYISFIGTDTLCRPDDLVESRVLEMSRLSNVTALVGRQLVLIALLCCALVAQAQDTPMLINYGLTGSWYEPATNGQGVIVDIVPDSNQLVAYWFTYPEDGAGREWYIAQGDISGGSASLTVFQTENGIFDTASAITVNAVGSATMRFSACTQATWDYAFDDGGPEGFIELQRLSPDVLCANELPGSATTIVTHGNAWLDLNGVWLFEGCVALEFGDSHGTEVFTFSNNAVHITIDSYQNNTTCQGEPTEQVFEFDLVRRDKTTAFQAGEEVIANRFLFVDPESGEEVKQLIYVDDRGDEPLFSHGIMDSPPDADGFPTELFPAIFTREGSGSTAGGDDRN